jgi:predicted short-subunit dehydrogenase-like oxidoreductase (DUF2520 family)
MRIVVIGSGNVAYHLIQAFSKSDATVFVHARNKTALDLLKLEFPSITILSNFDLTSLNADIVLISVKDDVLNGVFEQYTYDAKTLVVHTSGTQHFQDTALHQYVGVFYPLQTFSKTSSVRWENTPILIEAQSDEHVTVLAQVAQVINAPYFETNAAQRTYIHLAAVMTSNFTNHLLGKAAELLDTHSIDYHILQPLVEATILKAFTRNPFEVQTGPAVRNDTSTIETHLSLLKQDSLLQKIYSDISESIQKTSNLDSNNE